MINDIRFEYDYNLGAHEVLLSGSVGSAKTELLAHIIATHCLAYPRARVCIGRKAMPDLKRTIFAKVVDHISSLPNDKYEVREHTAEIFFDNGSEVISTSWSDKKYKKVRSLDLSMAVIEELTENEDEDKQAYDELKMRVNRLPNIPEQLIICATNPGDPSHFAYKYFIENQSPTRHVYYSVTSDNPFLNPSYIQQLKADLDPKMVQRMIYGRWISISGEGVYYQYDRERHEPAEDYVINKQLPIVMSWDFNIGSGKPMSATFSQYDGKEKHFFDEVVIEGARTQNILEEAWNRGLFDTNTVYHIRGDASGVHKDTRNNLNDYEIITNWLNGKTRKDDSRILHSRQVPISNPPVRERHNISNAWLLNDLGQVRVKVYPKCKVLREGFKLVKLKPGANYLEDDSKYYQHVTTAATYDIHYEHATRSRGKTEQRQL